MEVFDFFSEVLNFKEKIDDCRLGAAKKTLDNNNRQRIVVDFSKVESSYKNQCIS